jgi:hypothetical protein
MCHSGSTCRFISFDQVNILGDCVIDNTRDFQYYHIVNVNRLSINSDCSISF